MATASTVHMFDSGVQILIAINDESGVVDLTTIQSVVLFFQKPDKSVISHPCNIVNAAEGMVSYITSPSDLDQAGRWSAQVVVQFANNNVRHSSVGTLTVAKNLM